tara:strand:- start:539 stop:670 length:132 start_codon:yes stop_codon:yes gene_type:complete
VILSRSASVSIWRSTRVGTDPDPTSLQLKVVPFVVKNLPEFDA